MPPVKKKLDINVKVPVSKRFITDNTVKTILLREHDWNEPKLSFQGKTIAQSNLVTIKHPEVIDGFERHKSSVDAANNLRDNLTSYHDIISTERWEMRFFSFFLSLDEANAYSSFRVFSEEGDSRGHSSFKDNLTFNLLEHCKKLKSRHNEVAQDSNRMFRSDSNHSYVSMSNAGNKRKRLDTISYLLYEQNELIHSQLCNTFVHHGLLLYQEEYYIANVQKIVTGIFLPLTHYYSLTRGLTNPQCHSPLCPNKQLTINHLIDQDHIQQKGWISSITRCIINSISQKGLKQQAAISEFLLTEQPYI
ncbi:uncharacterized protein RHIMIDRAFT_294402 [Rhizopus microsporus ATCC 52813]|uniref:Uncharacterized protein n=1 Tax=Rhizopus microsporus ATCC 52813 TaxID=1340429 RepID=A0A2G4SLD5_RHIZD|nr:uncharacterized protein RHIMIDRAFT_294402 [Rhizopus microsporus ATCC 52813]PHZ09580.1 hypothetical protein RHIMIDRAFT_294402 [Rhizopus microsporus ATCC 52813]